MKNIFKYWLPLFLYAAFIFYLSGMPSVLPQVRVPYFDKIAHLAEYGVLGILASRAFKNSSLKILRENFTIAAILFAALYGVSDEFHQLFVPTRQFSIFDMVSDGIGGIMGAFIHGRHHSV